MTDDELYIARNYWPLRQGLDQIDRRETRSAAGQTTIAAPLGRSDDCHPGDQHGSMPGEAA